jgi:hypothetical protein
MMTPPQVIKYLRKEAPKGPWRIIVSRRGKVVAARDFGPASQSACKRFIGRWQSREDEGFVTYFDLGRASDEALAGAQRVTNMHGQRTIVALIEEDEVMEKLEVVH